MSRKMFTSWRTKVPYHRLDIATSFTVGLTKPAPKKRTDWAAFRAETKAMEKANRIRDLKALWIKVKAKQG